MYLHGNLNGIQDQITQLIMARDQYQTLYNSCAQAGITNCDPSNLAIYQMQIDMINGQIAVLQGQLQASASMPAPSVPQPVGPSVPSAVPPSAGTPAPPALLPVNSNALAPSAGASPFSPTDIDVQSVTGNTSALMPGSAGETAGAAPQKSNAGLILALLAAAAALMGG